MDSYVDVGAGTQITHEVHILDDEVEITIGSTRGFGNTLRLFVDEPRTCTELAEVLVKAAQEFDTARWARARKSEAADKPQSDAASRSSGDVGVVLAPAPS